MSEIITITPQKDPTITFSIKDKWIIKLTEEGIRFNRREFPDLNEEGFVKEFITILEYHFNVKFIRTDETSNHKDKS